MKVKAISLVTQHDREVAQILELEAKRQASGAKVNFSGKWYRFILFLVINMLRGKFVKK